MTTQTIYLPKINEKSKEEIDRIVYTDLNGNVFREVKYTHGKRFLESNYKNGRLEGLQYQYDWITGVPVVIWNYENGVQHGEQYIYDYCGELKETQLYEYGEQTYTNDKRLSTHFSIGKNY